jgi:hypothetical protein
MKGPLGLVTDPNQGILALPFAVGPQRYCFVELHLELVRKIDLDVISGSDLQLPLQRPRMPLVDLDGLPERQLPMHPRAEDLRIRSTHAVLEDSEAVGGNPTKGQKTT